MMKGIVVKDILQWMPEELDEFLEEHFPETMKEIAKHFQFGDKKMPAIKQGEVVHVLARITSDGFEGMEGYVIYHEETTSSFAVGHSFVHVSGDESFLPVIDHE